MVIVFYYKKCEELPYVTVKWFATLAEAYVELKVLAYATLLMRQVDQQYIDDYAGSYAVCDDVRNFICERFETDRILSLLPEAIGQRLEFHKEFYEPERAHGAYIQTANEFIFYLNEEGYYHLEECKVVLPHTLPNV